MILAVLGEVEVPGVRQGKPGERGEVPGPASPALSTSRRSGSDGARPNGVVPGAVAGVGELGAWPSDVDSLRFCPLQLRRSSHVAIRFGAVRLDSPELPFR
jgi:hypothetical protein